eukprot:scaffold240195_cov17-Tisochrysis_lutea.AAC.1
MPACLLQLGSDGLIRFDLVDRYVLVSCGVASRAMLCTEVECSECPFGAALRTMLCMEVECSEGIMWVPCLWRRLMWLLLSGLHAL